MHIYSPVNRTGETIPSYEERSSTVNARTRALLAGVVGIVALALGLSGSTTPADATPTSTIAVKEAASAKPTKCKPKPTTSKKTIKANGKEVKAAKKAALKKLESSDVVESGWIIEDGVRYGRAYVGKKFDTGLNNEQIRVRVVVVPTKWGAKCRHNVTIMFERLDLPTEWFTASRKSGTYKKDFYYDFGESGEVQIIHGLPGPDAVSDFFRMGNS